MGVSEDNLLHAAPAVSDEDEEEAQPSQTWFFKLFSLRGITDGQERMCFFAYLQRSEQSPW